jgi:hypothetical protein
LSGKAEYPVREEMRQAEPTDHRPDQRPPFACSRREFLPSLLKETIVTLGMLRGGRGGRLSELTDLPNEQLALIKPVVNRAFEIHVEDDYVLGRHKETGIVLKLFSVEESERLAAFNLFDGKRNLGQVGRFLAEELGWDEARGFAQAREVFLSLVSHLVCVPKEPPSLDDPVLRGSPKGKAKG